MEGRGALARGLTQPRLFLPGKVRAAPDTPHEVFRGQSLGSEDHGNPQSYSDSPNPPPVHPCQSAVTLPKTRTRGQSRQVLLRLDVPTLKHSPHRRAAPTCFSGL